MTDVLHTIANDDFGRTRTMHMTSALMAKAAIRHKDMKGAENPAIAAAEAAMSSLSKDFNLWMQNEVDRLENAFKAFEKTPAALRSTTELFRAAHDLRGQATVYGYPLAGEIAGSLSKMLDQVETDFLPIELIAHHVDAVKIVFKENIRDNSNTTAVSIVENLRHAIQHVVNHRQRMLEQSENV
jgi:chemotaxis protein histidine kinase CheA